MHKFSKMQATCNQSINGDPLLSQLISVIPFVVNKYCMRKAIPQREKQDVELFVIEKLINKRDQIISSFKSESSFKTYSIAIVNRMVCEVIRKESRHWYAVEQEHFFHKEEKSSGIEVEKELFIKGEIKRYRLALRLFDGGGHKEYLFFKYYFGLSLSIADIEKYTINQSLEIHKLLNTECNNKGEKFDRMAQVVNLVENKKVKSDALRMWLNKQLSRTISILNANGNANYSKETLGILLEVAQLHNY